MKNLRRSRLYVAPVIGSIALAAAIGGSASAGTQQIGPYQVTDNVTQANGNTTVTYTVTQTNNKKAQIDALISPCNQSRIISISGAGKVWQDDPSTKQQGPLVRWPNNNTDTYSYTVQGLFDPATEGFAAKSGSTVSKGTVQGIGCNPTGTSTTPGGGGNGNNGNNGNNGTAGTTGTTGNGQVAGQQNVLGQQIATCADRRRFTFRLHSARTARITDVQLFVNGKRKAHKRGHDIRKITIKRLPQSNFTLKIVSRQSTGSTLTSVRKYKGCTKGHPRTTGHHVRHH